VEVISLLVLEVIALEGSGSPSSLNRFATRCPTATPQRVLLCLHHPERLLGT